MVQDGHYTRGYIQFIGALIAKIRLPSVANSQFHPMYRTMDLLISALNNIRREMSFFEITASKYHIQLIDDPPNYITRSYLDLFTGVSSPSSSLLEGMVVLWATEHVSHTRVLVSTMWFSWGLGFFFVFALLTTAWHAQCYRSAWLYAQSFTSTLTGPSSEPHIAALHQALIPNWTSPAFSKFVDACRGLVDELAISPTIANGKEEMQRCEQVFRQVCWLAERFWPDVDGIGEDDDGGRLMPGVTDGQGNDASGFAGVLNGSTEAGAAPGA
jgi:thiaminase